MLTSVLSIPKDYYDVKQVDRKLAYSVIKSPYVFCDVGGATGTDATSFSFVASFGVCLDINKTALKKGKKTARALQIQHKMDYVKASATNLPFQNGVFDLVTSFSVIDHLPNKKNAHQAIKEFSRITKPRGYVVVTIPNKLFVIGTILMKIKAVTQAESFFEQRFTPKELAKFFVSSGLTILRYDSKYPTSIGTTILQYNIPKIFQKMPKNTQKSSLSLIEKMFKFIETDLPLTLLGARFGLLGQKSFLQHHSASKADYIINQVKCRAGRNG
jgi:ubiquinone/menaquinone biosynthesis C-methylase UbiE